MKPAVASCRSSAATSAFTVKYGCGGTHYLSESGNGYTVLKCAVKSYKELVTVIGSLLDVNVGSVLLIYGNWKVDSRYGRQFAAESWEETLPATVFGIEKYLGSGLIKGVGPKYAKKIVAQFGIETLEVIETDISRLQEVDGIGKNESR